MHRTRRHHLLGAAVLTATVLCGCSVRESPTASIYGEPASAQHAEGSQAPVPVLRPEVLAEVAHDPSAFTQGLVLHEDTLYEGTGLEDRSQLRELDPVTGELQRSAPLPGGLFGEGVAVAGDRIWQLTWRDGVVLEWDRATLTLRRQLPMDGEGWGLCDDGTRLLRSDGTDRLRFHDRATFAEIGSVAVTLDGEPVTQLNELECDDGEVWANVLPSDVLVRIDPTSGRVTALVDAAGLLDPADRPDPQAVLNGIAALGGGEFLLTGKLWPVSFRVRFVER